MILLFGKRVGPVAAALLLLTACSTTSDYSPEPSSRRPERPSTNRPQGSDAAFTETLYICGGITVSNAPPADTSRKVENFDPIIRVGGVPLAVNPAPRSCLSSGFGTRNERLHKGVDYHYPNGTAVLAAGSGTIMEMTYRGDYGNMVVINHGGGVYTRYAHLAGFDYNIEAGEEVAMGQQIGLMGNTSDHPIPIHLHYEILTGNYDTPKKSFGLTPVNPLSAMMLQ
ncbi:MULTISPECIES: M23 family metallopeptidase [Asticcacaulis]|uniref:M23 family metallopeptidase n=1 Tax=Asticcacaulis TaxID=76890 RepID=UPI001AE1664E|nr:MULTISPECIES: M23 family metallopeptidase [Asticcacaulis]MBP2161697.1 murein DD-endopeptidase MepM/ murein hydrolase activator NlpD [Asticcacaulis solisilvae]MDR6802678.1 murein DD-endopeptidase MepM/ murein hydrolase activator NlpD [Asticcacaulis sp. BE141]